ncbi:hypothetical protein [Plantactinospora endophytica]|uniref:hypothetical protein n=1 Tax=Plantactinospora endophytica TaxID=673535 RepID=UPI003627E48F
MAYRTWGRVLLAALLVGLVSGAGQLGMAYGLGLVRFNRGFDGAAVNQWPAQLVWVGWFAMVAAVLGGIVADQLVRRYSLPSVLGSRAAISAVAALGALAVAPLCMQPARTAQVASADPVTLAGVAAALGALVGLAATLAVLSYRPVAWNVGAITGAVWFLALLSVLPSLGPTDPLPAIRLGGVDPTWLGAGTSQRLAVVTMPALALVAGALTGALARRRELPLPVVASSGVAGPAMLALAYVVAGKGNSTDAYQAAPYWGALIALGAGALGSVLAATARWPLTSTDPAETSGANSPTEAPVSTEASASAEVGSSTGAPPYVGAHSSVDADPSGAGTPTGAAGTTPPGGAATTTAGADSSDPPTEVLPTAGTPNDATSTAPSWPGSTTLPIPSWGGDTSGSTPTGDTTTGDTTTRAHTTGDTPTGAATTGDNTTGDTTTGDTSTGDTTAGDTTTGAHTTGDTTTGGTMTSNTTTGGATTGAASADAAWRTHIPGTESAGGDSRTGGDPASGTAAATPHWTPAPIGGEQTEGEWTGSGSGGPVRAQMPSSGTWSFDTTTGIPTPRVSAEYPAPTEQFTWSTPTEQFTRSAPAEPVGGRPSSTEPVSPASGGPAGLTNTGPVSPASGGPATGSAESGLPAGWAGARRFRTEDFWPTAPQPTVQAAATPPVTPEPAPAPAPPPAAADPVHSPAAGPTSGGTPTGERPVTGDGDTHRSGSLPAAAQWSARVDLPPVTPAPTGASWDAFAPVSRPRPDRHEPSTEPAAPAVGGATGSSGVGSDGRTGTGGQGAARVDDDRPHPSGPAAGPATSLSPPPRIVIEFGGILAEPGRTSAGPAGTPAGPDDTPPSRTEPGGTTGNWTDSGGAARTWTESGDTTGNWPEPGGTAGNWPEPGGTAKTWTESGTTPGTWTESAGTAGNWPEPGGAAGNWPESGGTARTWSEPGGMAGNRTGSGAAGVARTGQMPSVPVVSGDAPVPAPPVQDVSPPVAPHPAPAPEAEAETTPAHSTGTGAGVDAGTGDAERPTGRIRRGLFRRNKGGNATDPEQTGAIDTGKGESKQRESKGRNRSEEPVPARDEEYVDWVSGLSEPDPAGDDPALDRSVRRSLRSTGRHAAD